MSTIDYRGMTSYPRGIRNNNPGNLRPTGSTWQGQTGVTDNFMVFQDIIYGCRALGTDLSNKYFRGLNTVTKIIGAYAPPSENNTVAYINAVAASIGMGKDIVLTWNKATLAKFMRAVIMHENGAQGAIVTDQNILDGIAKMSPNILLKVQGF